MKKYFQNRRSLNFSPSGGTARHKWVNIFEKTQEEVKLHAEDASISLHCLVLTLRNSAPGAIATNSTLFRGAFSLNNHVCWEKAPLCMGVLFCKTGCCFAKKRLETAPLCRWGAKTVQITDRQIAPLGVHPFFLSVHDFYAFLFQYHSMPINTDRIPFCPARSQIE